MVRSSASSDRRMFGLAVLIVITGLSIFGWTIFSGLSGIGDELVLMTVPGTTDLELQEVGDYTIFYESVSVIDERFRSTGETFPSGLAIEIVDISSGEKVDLRSPTSSSTYTIGSRSGRSVMAFSIDHPGVYRMTTLYSPGRKGPEVVLAVGHDFMGKMISMMIVSFVAFFGSIIIAAAILISTQRKKQREEERLREEERMLRGR
ncbi:MAG TPA: hypothetical protein HA349_03175 [Methanotrichaceae archaeon]|nr:hypothetical protein [Methanotrichaceae archaeon]